MKTALRRRMSGLFLLVFTCIGVSQITTAVAQVATLPKVNSVVSSEAANRERQTRTNTSLPSKHYHLRVDAGQGAANLGPLDPKIAERKGSNQIGITRPVEISSSTSGRTFKNPDGSRIAILAIKSPGARAMRVHFENFELPAGDEVYVYGSSGESTVSGPYKGKGFWGDKEFWSGLTEGDSVVIEYYSKGPPGSFRVSGIGHIFADLDQTSASPDVLSCEVDASCSSDVENEKNMVARILFVGACPDPDSQCLCTGTLLADRAQDFIPYFLTANHCISTETSARSVVGYWRYRTTACNSGILRSDWTTTQGANLLAADPTRDYALLNGPPAPSGAWFSGWDPNPVGQNTSVFGLHHPGTFIPPQVPSYLRRANGFVSSTTNNSCGATGLLNGYETTWTSGIVERGSSGSGLWYTHTNGQHYLVGVLSCGPVPESCAAPFALYSKFSEFYPQIRLFIDPAQPNPIDDPTFFVTQHYSDFLNRAPDQAGLNFWVDQINSCNGNPQCVDIKRQNVSAAFFLSIEFQETGFYVITLQRAAFGKISNDSTRRITFQQFLNDAQQVSAGVVQGQPGWDVILDQNKTAYAQNVVGSAAFINRFPTTLPASAYVDALFASAGVTPTSAERQAAITAFGGGGTTGRAAALRKVAETSTVKNAEFNSAFVLMQYFGYMRRNPTDPPDSNDSGYQFWLNKLNQFNGNFINSEMVKAFIVSGEYRDRFN